MKKFLILFLAVMFAVTTSTVFASDDSSGEFSDVQNESKSAAFDLSHYVGRISYFKAIITSTLIEQAGTTTVGRLVVRNNTRDGYELSVTSSKGGVLEPASDDDGEADIKYSLKFTIKGDIEKV